MPTSSPPTAPSNGAPPAAVDALHAELERLTRARDALRDALNAAVANAHTLPLEERTIARALATALTDLVSLHTPDGTLVYCSPSVERVLGWTPGELAGMRLVELLHPDDLPRGRRALLPADDAEKVAELRVRRSDGGYTWLETRTCTISLDGARYRLHLGREVAQRKAAELALREREEWTRELIARSALGMYRATADGRFLDVNPALVTMLGYDSAEELVGVHIAESLYVDPEDRTRLLEQAAAGASSLDVRWRRRDGREILVRIAARLLHGADGEVAICEGIVEDVTERLRRESLLHRSERMASLGRMVAGVAHELNNPLAAICGFAQLLRRSPLSEEDRTAVETIEREAQRAARVVSDLLGFARHDGVVRLEPVDVAEVLRYVARTQRYTMESLGIRCLVEVSDEPLWVEADRGQLEQIVLNLTVNARQACAQRLDEEMAHGPASSATEPPLVRLSAVRQDGSVAIEVADTGVGIPPATLSRIWDPFWTTKPDGEGVGLGLAVVHAGVSALGGQIDVTSEPGRGTCFRVLLPAGESPGAGPAPGEGPLRDVLLVGTAPLAPRFAERFLSERGHAVVALPTVAAALGALEQGAFDVVILNIPPAQAPSAGELVRQVRQAAGERSRLVVAARRLARTTREALALPGVVLLNRPNDVDELRRAVEE